MRLIHPPQLEEPSSCPYLSGRSKRYEFFLAANLNGAELSHYLSRGWRKFGLYYFRPACPNCRACIPLRIPVADFVASRSQRRVLKKAANLTLEFGPLQYTERAYAIFRDHAQARFGIAADADEFLFNFYLPSCPALQSEVYVDGELAGLGFLDLGEDCLSSVYFCFDPRYAAFNLGTFSVLKEIEWARQMGLRWYYLGYYVPGCRALAYKDSFRPRQYFDWETESWQTVADSPEAGKGSVLSGR